MPMVARLAHPYNVLVLDGLIEPAHMAGLMGSWPKGLIRHFDYPGGVKRNFNQSHQEFHSFVTGDQHWSRFWNETIPAIKRAADIAIGPMASSGIKMEFSELPNGGGLLPHPDTARKVMTAIVYFTPDVWHPSWGGEFEVLRHKERPFDDFTNTLQRWEDVETVMAVPYVRGRVAIFHRCPWSLHGVRNVRCPAGFTRDSVTLNWLAS